MSTNNTELFRKSDFSFHGLLGRGNFGRVYACRVKKTGLFVAIKKIEKEFIQSCDLEKQLYYEMYIHSKLKHPNIIRLYTYFHDFRFIYLVMEFASQDSLYHNMRKEKYKRFTEHKAAKFIYQTADALNYFHDFDYVHSDVKPENILLDSNENVKLTDFGLAWPTSDTSLRGVCGTRDYLAPELLNGNGYDKAIDLWALGVLCFELLVGRSPFASKHQDVTEERIANVDLRFPKIITATAEDLIRRLIRYDPDKRLCLNKVMSHRWIAINYDPRKINQ